MACDRSGGRCRGRRARGEERGPAIGTATTEGQAAGFGRAGAAQIVEDPGAFLDGGCQCRAVLSAVGIEGAEASTASRASAGLSRATSKRARSRSSGHASRVGLVRSGASAPRASGAASQSARSRSRTSRRRNSAWGCAATRSAGNARQAVDGPPVDGGPPRGTARGRAGAARDRTGHGRERSGCRHYPGRPRPAR